MAKGNTTNHVYLCVRLQEKRRAERAEQNRIRSEKEKERAARREVCVLHQYHYLPLWVVLNYQRSVNMGHPYNTHPDIVL